MKVQIIIPTYNEKENLARLIPAVFAVDPNFHVLVVDDNSSDGTGEVAEKLTKKYSTLKVMHRQQKAGLGTAYLDGFRQTLRDGADLIMEMDADFSHDPKKLPQFIAAMDKFDLVVGSRYIKGGGVVNWPLRRKTLSKLANLYAKVATGLPLSDLTSGFKCFKRKVLESVDLNKVRSDGYGFQIEMNYRAHKKDFKLGEIPITFVDRKVGKSKMSLRIILEAFCLVWRLRWR